MLDFFKDFGGLIFVVVLLLSVATGSVVCGISAENANQRAQCKSLQRQGVKAYLSEGTYEVRCHVVQRDVVQAP